MAYITLTRPQRDYLRSLARDMGLSADALAARIAATFPGRTLDSLAKREASLLIGELRREQDAVTLRGFAQKGAAID